MLHFVKLTLFWWNIRFNKLQILLYGFVDHLLSNDVVEKNVKFYYDSFEWIILISTFFSHKESVFFLKNMLNLTDNVRPPYDLPVFV